MLPRSARIATYVEPLAAAMVAINVWILVHGAIGLIGANARFRLVPFATRYDAKICLVGALVIAALVIGLRRRLGLWFRRLLAAAGLAAIAETAYFVVTVVNRDTDHSYYRLAATPLAIVDIVILLLASGYLLLARGSRPAVEASERPPWRGLFTTAVLLLGSAVWTFFATRPSTVATGNELANVHLGGYFMANNAFVAGDAPISASPPAVPRMWMQGDKMVCGGDWHVVTFPDHPRCLPLRALVTIEPTDVEAIEVAPIYVGDPDVVTLRLHDKAAADMAAALHATRSFRLVLVNARGELVSDPQVNYDIPGPVFELISADAGKTLQAMLATVQTAGD